MPYLSINEACSVLVDGKITFGKIAYKEVREDKDGEVTFYGVQLKGYAEPIRVKDNSSLLCSATTGVAYTQFDKFVRSTEAYRWATGIEQEEEDEQKRLDQENVLNVPGVPAGIAVSLNEP